MQDAHHDPLPAEEAYTVAPAVPPSASLPRTNPPAAAIAPEPARPQRFKNPWLAGLLSAFPGMGNVYNGLYLRGVTFFVLAFVLIYMTAEVHPLFGFVVAFLWIFNALDAYRQATLINYGYGAEPDLSHLKRSQASTGEKLISGGVLLAVGSLALLDRFFRIDLDWVVELWPVTLILAGGWLVWSALQSRKTDATSDYDAG